MRLAVAALAAAVLTLAFPAAASTPPLNGARAPAYAQFVARLFVEGLGRLPRAGEWRSAIDDFEAECSVGKMRWYGSKLFTSDEFAQRPYDTRARLLALYRAYFAAELTLDGADSWAAEVEAHGWDAVASRLAGWIVDACGTTYPSVGFQPRAASVLREDNYGAAGTVQHADCEAAASSCALNRLLQEARSGSRVVRLPAMAVIDVTEPVVVPEGVTLTTEGDPAPRDYARMARLVRRFPFTAHPALRENALVIVEQGATLRNVWVDGQRQVGGAAPDASQMNVLVMGGAGAAVRDTVQSNANAGTTIFAAGQSQAAPSPYAGVPCRDATIAGNRITAYPASYLATPERAAGLTDGITVFCERAVVEDNDIIDASDAGIAVFASLGPVVPLPQASVVRNNRILSAGNPMLYGIVLDTQGIRPGCAPDHRRRDFEGTVVTGNTIFGGPHTHFDTGISVGARILWGRNYPGTTAGLRLARVTGNRIGLTASAKKDVPHTRVGIPIAVAGAYQATVKSNTTQVALRPGLFRARPECAKLNAPTPRRPSIVASVRAGWASGTFDRFDDQDISGCVCPKSSPDAALADMACTPESPGLFGPPDPPLSCS